LEPVFETLKPILESLKPVLQIIQDVMPTLKPLLNILFKPLVLAVQSIAFMLNFLGMIFRIVSSVWLGWINFLRGIMSVFNGIIQGIANAIKAVEKFIKKIFDTAKDILNAIGNLGGGGFLGGGGGGGFLGFQQGSLGGLARDQLLRLPGMEAGAGLVKAHVGEQIIPKDQTGESGNTFIFNIRAIDPMSQKEEIRQVVESLFLQRKLRVM